jgi:hypothetical protein
MKPSMPEDGWLRGQAGDGAFAPSDASSWCGEKGSSGDGLACPIFGFASKEALSRGEIFTAHRSHGKYAMTDTLTITITLDDEQAQAAFAELVKRGTDMTGL